MNHVNGEHRTARGDNYFRVYRVVAIFVPSEETKDQAWLRHVKKNPQDRNVDIKIFNFASQ